MRYSKWRYIVSSRDLHHPGIYCTSPEVLLCMSEFWNSTHEFLNKFCSFRQAFTTLTRKTPEISVGTCSSKKTARNERKKLLWLNTGSLLEYWNTGILEYWNTGILSKRSGDRGLKYLGSSYIRRHGRKGCFSIGFSGGRRWW